MFFFYQTIGNNETTITLDQNTGQQVVNTVLICIIGIV